MRRYWINDGDWDLEYFGFPISTFSLFDLQGEKIKTYNPEEYDLVPKKGIIEKKIKELEEQIRRTESQKKLESEGWDNKIRTLQSDIDELKKRLNP